MALKLLPDGARRRPRAARAASSARPRPSPRSTTPTSSPSTPSRRRRARRFLTMELVDGADLAERDPARTACRSTSLLELALPDGRRASSAAHARGIVHRDLKPAEHHGRRRRAA
ncbi:MAG: hypothetical protein MZV64_63180 [Ignavibacteriales bacterium]|nr:hypothetical protein [Ignavibacteriales bacterium]